VKISVTWLFPICFWAWNFTIFCLGLYYKQNITRWLEDTTFIFSCYVPWAIDMSLILVRLSQNDTIFKMQLNCSISKYVWSHIPSPAKNKIFEILCIFIRVCVLSDTMKWIYLEPYLQINCLSFYWNQLWPPDTRVWPARGTKPRVFIPRKRLGLAFKFGFKFPVGGSVPVQIYKLEPKGRCCRSDTTDANAVYIQLVKCKDFISCVSRNYSRKYVMQIRKLLYMCNQENWKGRDYGKKIRKIKFLFHEKSNSPNI
jgi:hypothetical protein